MIKTFFQLLPTVLSIIVTAAHFFRAGKNIYVILSLLVLVLLFIKYRLSLNILRVSLILSIAMWIHTMTSLINIYIKMNISWIKIVYILGGVIIFQILAFAILFFSKNLENIYSKSLIKKK